MRDVAQRLRRLLFIVPYVAKHPEGVAVEQLAKLIGGDRLHARIEEELNAIADHYEDGE